MMVSPNRSPSARLTPSLQRFLRPLILIFLCLIPAIVMGVHVYKSTPNFPMYDQWDALLFNTLDMHYPLALLTTFTQFHNEHRIFFTRTLSWATLSLTNANFRVETLPTFALSAACLWLVYLWFRRYFAPIASTMIVIVAVLIFSLRNTATYVSGFQTPFLFVLLFLMLALNQIVLRPVGWQPLYLAAIFAACASFSLSSGTTSWFILFLILITRGYRKPQYFLFWITVTVICLFVFFQDFPGGLIRVSVISNFPVVIKSFLIYLMSPFFTQHPDLVPIAIVMGAFSVLFLVAHTLWYWTREHKLMPLLFPLALILFSLSSAMRVAVGRLEFSLANPEQPLSSRYVVHAMW